MEHGKIQKMNFMKKILLVGGVVASFFLFSGILPAHAQQAGLTPGVITINGLSPDPATDQIAITGFASGGYRWNGEYYCGGNVEINIPVPVTNGYYVFDNPSAQGGYAYDLTQTHAGVPNSCPPTNRQYEAYTYSIGFIDNTHISSLGAGVHTITLCARDAVCDTQTFTISAPNEATGTITVVSQNSVTGKSVQASWDFSGIDQHGYPVDPCSGGCTDLNGKTYNNAVLGMYQLNPSSIPPNNYVLRSVEKSPIAQIKNPIVAFFANLINKAEAVAVCGFVNVGNQSCSPNSLALRLANPGDSANFTINWTPLGTIDVTPPPGLTSSNPSPQMGIADTNGAPGSSVNNLSVESVNYGSGPSGWLSIPDLSGITLNQGASPTDVTVTATSFPAGCGSGCTATVILQGITVGKTVFSSPFSVTLTVSNGSGISVSIAPTSASVQTGAAQPFTPTVLNDSSHAGVTWTLSGSGCSGATCGTLSSGSSLSGVSVTYTASSSLPSPAAVTIKATSVTDATKSASAVITVTAPSLPPPTCTLTPSPTSVIVPGTTTLKYKCLNVPQGTYGCSLTDSNGTPYPPVTRSGPDTVSGTQTAAPTVNTQYTITCVGPHGSQASATVSVSVTNPGTGECPPQGCTP